MFKRMAEFGLDSGRRVKGVTIIKPIVYGNVAQYFGKKIEEDGHTHQWTDISAYVKKIHFKLHESYGSPFRVVTKGRGFVPRSGRIPHTTEQLGP
uniref:YEATS domain-containing protein n=1 Tax=Monodon monoceros TaxID=40151 RepID=A0A8C6APV1_MONMO